MRGEDSLRSHDLPGGARVPYLDVGEPSAPALLVLRGLGDALATVEPAAQASALAQRYRAWLRAAGLRRRVVVPSWRVPVAAGDGLDTLAADVARLLDELDLRAVDVWGVSMGGMVALALGRDRPDLVARVVCESTPGHAGRDLLARLRSWTAQAGRGAWSALQRDTLRSIYTGRMPWRVRLWLPFTRFIPVPDDPARFGVLARVVERFDVRGWASVPGCPVLVTGGCQDVMTPPEHLAELAERLPGGWLVLVDGAGHGASEERPEAFRRVIAAFLAAGPAGDGHARALRAPARS